MTRCMFNIEQMLRLPDGINKLCPKMPARAGGGGRRMVRRCVMSLVYIALILSVIGLLLWLAHHFVPLVGFLKSIAVAVAATVVVLWLLREFGISEVLAWINMPQGS